MAPGRPSRARPRKRRRGRGSARAAPPPAARAPANDQAWREGVEEARGRRGRPAAAPPLQRPRPPWHPLPLAEILILAGAIALVVGLGRGPTTGGRTPLLLGVAAVGLGTIEFSLREHLSGFRSHTLLLALLPVVVFHTLVVLGVSAFTPVTHVITFATLVADVAVFFIVVRVLRLRLRDARLEHATGVGRRPR